MDDLSNISLGGGQVSQIIDLDQEFPDSRHSNASLGSFLSIGKCLQDDTKKKSKKNKTLNEL